MPNVQDQIAQARAAGYSDDEIAAKLATTPDYGDKIKTATSAGYKSSEIISHLSGSSSRTDSAPTQPLANESEGKAQGKRIMADIEQANREEGKLFAGLGETALNVASGIGSSALGGLRGLVTGATALATGRGVDGALADAAEISSKTQQDYTYQPRTGVGKLGSELASLPFGVAKAAATEVGGDIGQAVNGTAGRNVGEAIGNVAPDVAGALLGGRAGMRGAPKLQAYIDAKNAAARDRGMASAAKFEAGDAAALAGEPMPPTTGAVGGGLQSAGAAAADHVNMAAAVGATPEMQAIIQQAGTNAHPTASARHAEASSLPVPVELTAGQATGNAALMSAEKNNRGKFPELGEVFDRQNGQLIENFDKVRARVAPDVAARGTDLGQMAVDAYKDMDAPIRADISAKYKALEDANGGEFPLNARDFVVAADEALKKANRARFLPAEVQGILSDHRAGAQMTFADFENYRTILAEQARKADRAGDGTASYAIGVVREALENLPMIEESAAIRPLADAARSAARARFDRIKSDPAYKAAINDGVPVGEPSPLADRFIQSYVVNGRTANVQKMIQNLANDPINQQIIAAGVMDHIKGASGVDLRTNTGNVTQAGLNSVINRLDKKASLILGADAASTINAIGNVAGYTMKQSKGSFVSNSNTAPALMAQGGKLVNHALDTKTFGATKYFRDMLENRALQKSVQKSIQPGAGINYLDFPSLKAEMERNGIAAPAVESQLGTYIAAQKQRRAMETLSEAQSVDEAIKAVSDP